MLKGDTVSETQPKVCLCNVEPPSYIYLAGNLKSGSNLSGFPFIITLFGDCQTRESPSPWSVFMRLS